jgi:hypothetical protein
MRATRTSTRPSPREIECQRFRGALALVVAGARAGAVDPAAVTFRLGVHFGVAVNLAGGGQQEAGALLLGETQQVAGAEDAGEHRMLRIGLIMRRRGGAGEMVDVREARFAETELGRQAIDHVGFDEGEAGLAVEMREIRGSPGLEIVEASDARALGEEGINQMGTDEARAAGHQGGLAVDGHVRFLSSHLLLCS